MGLVAPAGSSPASMTIARHELAGSWKRTSWLSAGSSTSLRIRPPLPAAAPGHPLALLPGPVPLEDVREFTQLVVTDQSERTQGRDFGVFAYHTWRLTDVYTKHALMRAGLGWGGLPRWLIAEDLASGRLVELDLEPYRAVRSPLYAMHRTDRSPKPAASWLIDQFKRQLGCFNEFEPGHVPDEEPEVAANP